MDFLQAAKPVSRVGTRSHGVLVIHGITSTPGSMLYVVERLHDAGFHVECPLLPGHGTTIEDLHKVRWQDWVEHLQKTLNVLRERASEVSVLGLSLGGALSLYLAENNADIKGCVLINHFFCMKNLLPFVAPFVSKVIKNFPSLASDIKDPAIKEPAYPALSVPAGYQAILLSKEIQAGIHKVQCPTLIFKSREDHILPAYNATLTYERLQTSKKELIWLANSYHVATMDYDKDIICEKTIEFLTQL